MSSSSNQNYRVQDQAYQMLMQRASYTLIKRKGLKKYNNQEHALSVSLLVKKGNFTQYIVRASYIPELPTNS